MDVAMLISVWPKIAFLDADEPDVESFRQNLRFLVARDYGWLASELFEIEGELGWGPGHREWDGDFFPPPTTESSAHMMTFLRTLATVRRDTELMELLTAAARGTWHTPAGRFIERAVHVRETSRSGIIQYFYGKIATRHSEYTLGAARIYLAMWTQQRRFKLAVSGLIRLLFQPLTRLGVRAETVLRRTRRTFPGRAVIPQQAQPADMLLQSVAC